MNSRMRPRSRFFLERCGGQISGAWAGSFSRFVSVSGNSRGYTNTIPLQVEILYNEYNFAASFAVASILALLALLTLAIKTYVEWRLRAETHAEPLIEGQK